MSASPPSLFLHTERISLPQAVADRLRSMGDGAWDDGLVVLPTIETGRRVVDALLAGGGVVFPPKFATPLTLVPFGKGDGVATAAQAEMAWRTVLSEARDCPLTFGDQPGTKLAGSFVTLTRDLAAAGLDIPAAARILAARDARWEEWERLWKAFSRRLAAVGLRCPATAQIEAAASFHPPGIRKILVAGVADLPPLALRALRNVETEIFVHAPGVERGAFDEFGRARPEFWSRAPLPVRDSQIRVVADPVQLGQALVEIPAPVRLAVFCGDPGLSMDLSFALEEAGRSGFLPEGYPLNRHPIVRLAILLARLPADGSWSHLEALVFHPDFSEWLGDLLPAHRDWNQLGLLTFCASLEEIPNRLRCSRCSDEEAARQSLLTGLSPLFEKLRELTRQLSSSNAARVLRDILADLYGPRDLGKRPGDKEAAKAVISLLDEISEFPALGKTEAATVLTMLEAIPGTWTPAREPGAVEIEGWLELAGEDAPVMVLAGLNEGLLPTKRRVDALLPDAARAALGLDDAVSRHARDTAILHAALAVREPENIHILALRQSADGSPLKPSRLLLRVPDRELAGRVHLLVKDPPTPAGSAPLLRFSAAPLRIARPPEPARSLNVTSLKSYLACPLRFYLKNRLGFSAPQTGGAMLEANTFGTWIHDVLKRFGNDPDVAASRDAGEIRDWLLPRWDRLFDGLEDDIPLMLQRESGRLRLEAFAIAQAEMRTDGWMPGLVEWKFADLTPPGWPLALRGRIDRVDVRGEDLLLMDYKTGSLKKGRNPVRAAHLARAQTPGRFGVRPDYAFLGGEVWCDLQLPLYALAVELARPVENISGAVRLGYFRLADEVAETGLVEWEDAEIASAVDCAAGIAGEVARDAVLDWIAAGDFSRFAVDPPYDDFEELALSRFIEEGALIV